MPVQYTYTVSEIASPDLSNPDRKIKVITYRAGQLPPRNLYMDPKDYTPAEAEKRIKADIDKRMTLPTEIKST